MRRRNDDILWKSILEEVFDDLLCFLFPKAEMLFNLQRRFEFLDKELGEMYPEPEKKSDTKFVDKLVKVYQRDGTEEWVLVHIEVQDQYDPLFAKRMFKYYCRIFDRFDRPITAIAVFSGRDGHKLPCRYERSYQGSMLTYQYNTLCILDYEDKDLMASDNPFAMVVLAAKKALLRGKDPDKELLKQKLLIAKLLYRKGFSKRKIQAIYSFLYNYVRFANPETNRIFEKELGKIVGKKNTMGMLEGLTEIKTGEAMKKGIRKGRAQGRAKGRAAEKTRVVRRLLAEKGFTVKKIADIVDVSVSFVEKIKKSKK
jgi:predicted transposase YdaD